MVVHFKEWSKDNRKLAAAINNRIFLLRCRKNGVYPKHIVNEVRYSVTYKPLKSEPTIKIQVESQKLVKHLETCLLITDSEGKKLRKYNSIPPKIYGLVKVHKVRGSAMGNPASPILAELIMNSLINFHCDLQFTHEIEENGRIPFLDVWIIREGGHLKTDLYSKPIASHRTLHFSSLHTTSQKIAMIKSIRHKILGMSHESFHTKNFREQATLLIQNGYPRSLVRRIFHTSTPIVTPSCPPDSDGADKKYNKVIYIPGLSQRLIKVMRNSSSIIVSYYNKTVGKLFSQLKDKDPDYRQSGLVYKVNCKDCTGTYIGQTRQYFGTRIKQHQSDCMKQSNTTALAHHAMSEGHQFDFDDAKILIRENNWFKRNCKEMLFIKRHPNSINARSDIGSLNIVYSNLIKEIKL
ncbi:uncharacterized protein LOC123686588 [Harmonia axyridis]|uniref:uncharacterized protein LOC123686588 n=1 Tax=Harmonia axyridis TaxID=115357 RepID=UPI001E2769C2|nr:uncharacterized protein LOC123686588 [Harmonia axyridis]